MHPISMKPRLLIITFLVATVLPLSLQAQSWNITGNGNTTIGTNFLGTTNFQGLAFRTSNTERMRLTNSGNLLIGLKSGSGAKLQIANGVGVSLTSPGQMLVGQISSVNLGLDSSVIQARNNGAASSLFLNYFGGPVWIGSHSGVSDIYADADGFVGINTESPSPYRLKVSHASFGFDLENESNSNDWELVCLSGDLDLFFNVSFRGAFNATSGAYTSISDRRLKSNIQPMPAVLDRINQLRPSTYQFTNGDTRVYDGFIGQEVEQVFPNLVNHVIQPERNLDVYTLDYSGFGVIAIKGIQELEQTIQAQQQRISTLEERITRLEAALAHHN
jgi:hypothetical protein